MAIQKIRTAGHSFWHLLNRLFAGFLPKEKGPEANNRSGHGDPGEFQDNLLRRLRVFDLEGIRSNNDHPQGKLQERGSQVIQDMKVDYATMEYEALSTILDIAYWNIHHLKEFIVDCPGAKPEKRTMALSDMMDWKNEVDSIWREIHFRAKDVDLSPITSQLK